MLRDFGLFFYDQSGKLSPKSEATLRRMIHGMGKLGPFLTAHQVSEMESKWGASCAGRLLRGDLQPIADIARNTEIGFLSAQNHLSELINTTPDFRIRELSPPPNSFANSDTEMEERRRLFIKLHSLELQKRGLSDNAIRRALATGLQSIGRTLQSLRANPLAAFEYSMDHFLGASDPFGEYLIADRNERLPPEWVGIGVELVKVRSMFIVEALVDGGAAQTSGELHVGDHIHSVFHAPTQRWIELGQKFTEQNLAALLYGAVGSQIKLRVIRGDSNRTKEIELTRREYPAPIGAISVGVGSEGSDRIGFIRLAQFYPRSTISRGAAADFASALAWLDLQTVDALVLDLRENRGGDLAEASKILHQLLGVSPEIIRIGLSSIPQEPETSAGPTWTEKPVVVLLNAASASASEVVAGSIQAFGRGIVVGDTRTPGKAWSQIILQTPAGSLRVTRATWFTADGRCIGGNGIVPEIVLPSLRGDLEAVPFLECPPGFSIPSASPNPGFRPMKRFWTPEDLQRLSLASEERQAASPQFQAHLAMRAQIARRNGRRQARISLHEDEFRAEIRIPNVPLQDDVHLNEAANIARDFLRLQKPPSP